MQYLLCPRCRFRCPLNKHICTTCGYHLPSLQNQKSVDNAPKNESRPAQKAQSGSFWQSFLGLNAPEAEPATESAAEEPALG